MRILVTGATGYVGSRLVTELLRDGHQVVAATRKPKRLRRYGWFDEVTAVGLDANDAASARRAFADAGAVDVVYYLVHGIGQPGFRDADRAAATHVAEAARDAGVTRIVYLGGFVPDGDTLSEHLASRAEVAEALHVDGGPEVVWLGAAVIIGAGSTSFEMVRYVADRLLVIPLPSWASNKMEPISIRDVLYYLVAAADPDTVPAGAFDITGPDVTTYGGLLGSYLRATGAVRAGLPLNGAQALIPKALMARVAGTVVPVPTGLAADLIQSLDYPMTASDARLRDIVPDPPGGLTSTDDAVSAALSHHLPQPVNRLADPHHLADTDPRWAGGDALRLQQLAMAVTPPPARKALDLLEAVPGPVAAALRAWADTLVSLTPKRST
ncbi:NAD(P)H-binding protein [Mycobacterium sp. MYCO198283]|uniref:NAD(P)H-binding protein n=1 Tax=Mycobacterium sp. MYCO198283 TaxID=2883505 RepID=UPI001E63FE2F|nr:NAD(P)H-binding protein [Mycobacterium sp. MYCO198283]MCG5430830.1 NAD(P)H-binding protein [Mycobacterium sp. MYCO198283]